LSRDDKAREAHKLLHKMMLVEGYVGWVERVALARVQAGVVSRVQTRGTVKAACSGGRATQEDIAGVRECEQESYEKCKKYGWPGVRDAALHTQRQRSRGVGDSSINRRTQPEYVHHCWLILARCEIKTSSDVSWQTNGR
jgi:hypothetical protein